MSIASLTVDLTANLSKFEQDMGKGAQIATRFAEQSSRAQTTFLRALERTSERLGKTEADFLRVKAAELGASDAAEKLIARIEETGGASAKVAATGGAAFSAIAAAADAVGAKQRSVVADLIAGIRTVGAEAARLRAQAIADEKAGVINPDQLKAKLINVNAGQSSAVQQLKDAAAQEAAAQRVADAEAAGLQKRKAAFESLRATVEKLAYEDSQKQIAAAESVAAAEAATLAKRQAAFARLRDDVAKRVFSDAQAEISAQKRIAEEEAAALAQRSAAFDKLRMTVAKLNYNEQQAAAAKLKSAQDAAAASAESFAGRIEKMAGSIGKSRAELLAMEAAELGLTARLGPAIAKISEFDQKTGQAGKAVFGTKNQLLTLHYTLSDVVASLASGISPLTIALQQGGQVYDAFGQSFTSIFKTIGALITPARVAIGGIVGALGAFAYAAYEGSKQSRAFADSLVLTGNYAGVTEGQFNALAKRLAESGQISISSAREFEQAIVSTGQIGPKLLESATEAAARYGAATGQNAKEVATDFAGMGADVSKWATEHNKSLNFITSKQYEQIKAFQDSGRIIEAQGLIYDALNERLRKLEPNLGTLDRAIRAVTGTWHEFWDAAFDIGRTETIDQKIEKARAALVVAGRKINDAASVSVGGGTDPNGREGIRSSGVDDYAAKQEDLRLLNRSKVAQEATTATAAATSDLNKKGAAAQDYVDGFLKRSKSVEGLNRDLDEAKRKFADAAAAGTPVNAATQASILKKIREEYTDRRSEGQADRERKALLDQDLKFVQDNLAKEKDALAFSQTQLQALYNGGVVSLKAYFDAKRANIEQGVEEEANAFIDEAARLEVELEKKSLKPDERTKLQTQLNENAAKAAKLRVDASRATVLANIEEATATRQLTERVIEYQAALLQSEGRETEAAALRARNALTQARLFQVQAGGAVSDDDVRRQERAIAVGNAFADVQRKLGVATADAARAEEAYTLRSEQSAQSLYDTERGIYLIRSASLSQLGELRDRAAQLAAEQPDNTALQASANDIALAYAKAADSVDPSINRMRAAGKDLASSISDDITKSITDFTSLKDTVLSVEKDLLRVATQLLIKEPLEQAFRGAIRTVTEGDNPVGNFLKSVLGGGGGIATATATQTTAVVQSSTAMTGLAGAADAAASALARIAGSSGGGFGGSGLGAENFTGGGFGTGSGYGFQDLGQFLHAGGIAGAGGDMRSVSPGVFLGARRYHAGGLAQDEIPAILRRGEYVATENDPRHPNNWKGGGGGNVFIQNNAPAEVSAQKDSNGDWQVFVEIAAEKGAARGQARTAADLRRGTGPNSSALRARGVPLNKTLPRRT